MRTAGIFFSAFALLSRPLVSLQAVIADAPREVLPGTSVSRAALLLHLLKPPGLQIEQQSPRFAAAIDR